MTNQTPPTPYALRPTPPLAILDSLPAGFDLLFSRREAHLVYCGLVPKGRGPTYGGYGKTHVEALAAALSEILEIYDYPGLTSILAQLEDPGEASGVRPDELNLTHLMRRLGEAKHHVHVRYDSERDQRPFTVIVAGRRLGDTDDPDAVLLHYWREHGDPALAKQGGSHDQPNT